jgi:hypothetical protein
MDCQRINDPKNMHKPHTPPLPAQKQTKKTGISTYIFMKGIFSFSPICFSNTTVPVRFYALQNPSFITLARSVPLRHGWPTPLSLGAGFALVLIVPPHCRLTFRLELGITTTLLSEPRERFIALRRIELTYMIAGPQGRKPGRQELPPRQQNGYFNLNSVTKVS